MANTEVDCEINIIVPLNNTISLYFATFMFPCEDNKGVTFYDGDSSTGQSKRLCGYMTPDPIFSTGNRLAIRYDKSYAGSFDMTYVATDQGRGCGGNLFNYYGVFTSPLYPNTTRKAGECRWVIVVPTNLRVALRFELFDMGDKQYCSSDYLVLYELDGSTQREISRFCGGDEPGIITTKTSAMAVRYVQTVNFPGIGFKANFMGVHESK